MRIFSLLALLLLFFGLPRAVRAQTGTVRGTLLEVGTGRPVSFASVVLLRATDSTEVTGAQASEFGEFVVDQVPLGRYVLRATAVGYRTGRRVVTFTAAAPTLALGTLRLRTAAAQLQDVVVTAERPVVTDNLDKKVVDVTKDLTVTGGTAIDVLQNVPSVTVDQNGAVSLRGSSGVTIFIDGKPTGTTLDQIPASSIQSVEVITNPSSKYDASGAGGILNIVLKKELRDGLNGQVSANVGTGDKYNTALSLNYRKGKFNAFGSYDFRRDRRRITGTLDQSTTFRDTTLVLHQDRSGVSYQTSHAVRLGFDYNFTPDQTLTLAVQPRFNPSTNTETLVSRQVNTTAGGLVPAGTSNRANATTGTFRSADVTLDYRRTWAQHKGRELTANAVYTPLLADNFVGSTIGYPTDNSLVDQQQRTTNRTTQATAQVDYTHPLGEKSHFEAGLRSSARQYDLDYQFRRTPILAFDPSNRFIYNQYVQAAYGLYANAFGKFNYQAGLRAEQISLNGNQLATQKQFSQRYFDLFPSAVLAYAFAEESRVQLSYSKRIERPDAGELNPFTDRSDQLNLVTGNPELKPEYVHAVELGGEKEFAGNRSLSATAFYRLETNTAQGFRRVITDPLTGNLVTSTTRQNLGQETSYGLELVGTTPLTSFWKLNATASTFRRLIKGASLDGTPINTASQVYTARLNNNFAPTKKLGLQVALNYRSPINTSQGTRSANFNVDAAAKYNVLGDKGTFTLRVADVFNTLQFNSTVFGPGLATDIRFKRESRIAFLGFTYRFGQNQAKPFKKDSEDEGGGFE